MPPIRFKLDMDPPTLTFQDKELGWRTDEAGQKRPTIRKSDELAAVVQRYDQHLMTNPARPRMPAAGDLDVRIVFCFPRPGAGSLALLPEKPDADNAFKTLADALVKAGYIGDDKMIVHADPWKISGPRGWIHVTIKTADIEQIADVLDELYPATPEQP